MADRYFKMHLFTILFLITQSSPKGAVLTVIDGFGESAWPEGNGIQSAKMTFLDSLRSQFPYQSLVAAQQPVGLVRGEPGSSAVGHQTLGLGRTTPSYFQVLERSMNRKAPEAMINNKVLRDAFHTTKRAHFVGLCTDEGIFSHVKFLPPMFEAAAIENVSEVYVHCILTTLTDKPSNYLNKVESYFPKELGTRIKIAGVYSGETAMDKMRNWTMTQIAYDGMTNPKKAKPMSKYKAYKYLDSIGQIVPEFDPICIEYEKNSCNNSIMKPDDVVVYFHFREDKSYQLAKALIDGMKGSKNPKLRVLSLILFDKSLYNRSTLIIPAVKYNNTLPAVISQHGYKQLRVAEEYKRSHATIFFSGGIMQPIYPGEDRAVDFTSPAEKVVDLYPEMNASLITKAAIEGINKNEYKLIFINYANVDATGHTGNQTAVKIAAEFVDQQVKKIYEECIKNDYLLFITSDHGNGEELIELNGELQLYHTVNNVPFIVCSNKYEIVPSQTGKVPFIGNVAPSILYALGIEIPKEMEPPIIRKSLKINEKVTLDMNDWQAHDSNLSISRSHQTLLLGFILGVLTTILSIFISRFMQIRICGILFGVRETRKERRDSWNHSNISV
ncbi:2,3-bisphosphoglycerate-independent phosphoglycerate mutase [Tritrichomonas foetus]|uniref:phosphoglycerate mutase (2,3-diphosphoglycerate-independent) n=1 Tax=Tritrichomonas foetus TaxID=1144522 RepID=A0A1J4JYN8_9EUKA|nr:2,3-bisphosphoglycerate-independent phosphoglycerate mutase [Tritrichomonas foetus]|eukprot:OHT04279.1 2,3-bisphosphoglycerate-independent phosphoglycerate mutase [Tritrichomonas foetus]